MMNRLEGDSERVIRRSFSKETIEVNNPSTLEIIARVPKCGKEETSFAILKANEAWDNWKNRPAIERSAFLRKWFNLIETNKKGDTISSLEDFAIVPDKDDANNLSLKTESITRFDRPMHRKLNKLEKP